MKYMKQIAAGCLMVLALNASAEVIWTEDFDGAALGAMSGQVLMAEAANGVTGVVVDSTTAPSVAAAFTYASGQFVRLSTADNNYSAVRSSLNPIAFDQVSPTNTYSLSFDIYIPTELTIAVGDIQPRFELNGVGGNGPYAAAFSTLQAGQHHIVYTGKISDFIATEVNEARPFIGIDQGGAVRADYLYLDNIHFEIGGGSRLNVSPIDSVYFSNLKATRVESNPLVQWQHFGPGMSGYIDMFWINNGDSDAMYDSLDMGNSQVTLNGGAYWKSLRDSDGCGYHPDYFTAMDFSYTNPDFGLAVRRNVKRNRGEVFQTTDRGVSWSFLSEPIAGDNTHHNVISVDPGNDDYWYIGAGGGAYIKNFHYTKSGIANTSQWNTNTSEGFILYSKDRGVSWTQVSAPFESDSSFSAIIVDPRNSDIVYASCQHGVYKSENGGAGWAKITSGDLPYNQPRYMTCFYDADANDGQGEFFLYIVEITHYDISGDDIVTSGGVYRSGDGGDHWENLTGDLSIDMTQISTSAYRSKFYRAVAYWQETTEDDIQTRYQLPTATFSQFHTIGVDPTNKDRVYLVHNPKHDYAFPPGNIWMTENGGTNWYAAAREGTYWSSGSDEAYWKSRVRQPVGTNVKLAHVDREHRENLDTNTGPRFLRVNSSGTVYTAFAQQIMRSTDHGVSWNQMDDDETAPGSGHWVGRGNSNLPGNLFCLETGTPGVYLWGSGEHGIWRNTADGDSVYPGAIAVEQITGQSIQNYDTTSPCSIAVDPSDPDKIYSLQFRQSNRGILRYSVDGGATWDSKDTPLPTTMDLHESSLMVDHSNPDTLFFAVPLSIWTPYGGNGKFRPNNSSFTNTGVYKTTDGGDHWSLMNNGIPADASVLKLFMDPVDSQTIYAASNESHDDKVGGLYKTVNGGESWFELAVPAGVTSVNDVSVHNASGDIYIACGNQEADGSVGGAFVSHDDGISWVLIFDMPYVRGVDACAANADVMAVIAGNDDEIGEVNPGSYVTIDGAVTWHKINQQYGQPEKVSELKCDPYDDSILWCCLSGTGFWRADISPLRTGVAKPFFWDWMAANGQADRTADPDEDGFNNRVEYVAETDPQDSDSVFMMEIDHAVEGNRIAFHSARGRSYAVDVTDDLTAGNWVTLSDSIFGTGGDIGIVDDEVRSNCFYRVRVQLD